jgi:hypothetical protein
MKTYNEILKDIEKTKKALTAAEQKEKNLIDRIYDAPDLLTKRAIKNELNAEIIKTSEKVQDLKITIKMLTNNAKRALFVEMVPAIITTLDKYKNKPYGEKTRDKISDEIKTATGCRCYIKNSYGDSEINIYPAIYSHEIKIYTKDFKILNNENKIQVPTAENLKLYYINEYIENLDCLNIILFIVNCITRLLMSCSIIINITKINKQYIPIIFGLISLGIGCFFTLNQTIFEKLKMQILTINSILLLIITAITLYFIIVGGKHEKQNIK